MADGSESKKGQGGPVLPRPGDMVALEQKHMRSPMVAVVQRIEDAETGLLQVFRFEDRLAGCPSEPVDVYPRGSRGASDKDIFWRPLADRGPYA